MKKKIKMFRVNVVSNKEMVVVFYDFFVMVAKGKASVNELCVVELR